MTSLAPQSVGWRRPLGYLGLAVVLLGGLAWLLPEGIGAFPQEWDVGLGPAVNEIQQWWISNRRDLGVYLYFFDPLSGSIDWLLRALENLLMAIPWYVHVVGVGMVFGRWLGRAGGLAAGAGISCIISSLTNETLFFDAVSGLISAIFYLSTSAIFLLYQFMNSEMSRLMVM